MAQNTPSCFSPESKTMASFKYPRAFDPLDLELIERAYDAAWEQLAQLTPHRDLTKDDARKLALRKRVFIAARSGVVDMYALRDKAVASMPEYWNTARD
jgi:hypothetical protein